MMRLSRSHIQQGGYLQLFPCCDFRSFVFFVSFHCLPYVADSRPFCLLDQAILLSKSTGVASEGLNFEILLLRSIYSIDDRFIT